MPRWLLHTFTDAEITALTGEGGEPPVPSLTPDQQAAVSSLTPDDLERVDRALRGACRSRLRKVALVITTARDALWRPLPLRLLLDRLSALVEEGVLEAAGTLERIRFAEVALCDGTDMPRAPVA